MDLSGVEAARRLAATVVEREGLTPPIPVEQILRRYATVEEADWPRSEVAALVIRSHDGDSHVFYHRQDSRGLRERFTLAHELGHIIIPWQLGTSICFAQGDDMDDPVEDRAEDEANAFASGMLLPTTWLQRIVRQHRTDMSSLLEATAIAKASTSATVIALRRALPAGWVFRLNHRAQLITTAGTQVDALRSEDLADLAHDHGSTGLHGNTVHWFRMADDYKLVPHDALLTSTERLRQICADIGLDEAGAKHLAAVANGVVGGVMRDREMRDAERQYSELQYRFSSREEFIVLVSHTAFDVWLSQRVRELAAR